MSKNPKKAEKPDAVDPSNLDETDLAYIAGFNQKCAEADLDPLGLLREYSLAFGEQK